MPADTEALLRQASWLRSLALALLHSTPDADDAVQEVWTAALRSPPEAGRPPRPWLAQVLRNVIRSGARAGQRRRSREQIIAAPHAQETPAAADGVLERAQMHRRVAELVMALEEPYRSTLLLRFFDGRPAVDIAREAQVPEGTVRWRINEGLRRLRERLDQSMEGPRDRWRRALLPLAGLPGPAPRPRPMLRPPLLVGAAALTAAGAVVVWPVVTAHHAPHAALHSFDNFGGGSTVDRSSDNPRSESEDPTMKREQLQRAAIFFGIMSSVYAARVSSADDATLEEAVINACVEMNEKTYECREPFVDATLDMRLKMDGKNVTPAERAKMREKAMSEVVDRGSGPPEHRRAWCQKFISRIGARAVDERTKPLKACYAESSCDARVACLIPFIADVHANETKNPKR
jgi:RNA polymerase sigma-70 factor (ECF subfamily)